MKATLLVIAIVLVACGKKNDIPVYKHEAEQLAKYYVPKLDAIDQRIRTIMERGQTIPGDFPGVKEIGMQLQEARDQSTKLRGIIGAPPGQKSPLENQAEAAAKERNVDSLAKLVHDTEVMIDVGLTAINANLDAVETWIYNYDHKLLAMSSPKGEQTGRPETVGTPATGQPPPAVQPAAPAPAQGSAAPAQGSAAPAPKADQKQPAQPKAPAKP